jgi:hypothetical protein
VRELSFDPIPILPLLIEQRACRRSKAVNGQRALFVSQPSQRSEQRYV